MLSKLTRYSFNSSSPSKKSVERKSSLDYSMKQVDYPMKQMDYPMKEINQEIMRTFPQRKPPQKQSNSQHSPGPWMEPRKASNIPLICGIKLLSFISFLLLFNEIFFS